MSKSLVPTLLQVSPLPDIGSPQKASSNVLANIVLETKSIDFTIVPGLVACWCCRDQRARAPCSRCVTTRKTQEPAHAQGMRRAKSYPSDLTDAQWQVIAPYLPADVPGRRGRPRIWPLRTITEAILYVNRTGCAWRYLPADFLSVTWNQISQNPSRILRRHHELRRPVGHEGAGGEVAGSGPA